MLEIRLLSGTINHQSVISYEQAQEYVNKVVRRYIKKYGINNVCGGDLKFTEKAIVLFGMIFDLERIKEVSLALIFVSLMTIVFIMKYK